MGSAEDDGESLDGSLTCNTNSTTSGRCSSSDLTMLSDSIKTLGEKAVSVATLQAQELEENSSFQVYSLQRLPHLVLRSKLGFHQLHQHRKKNQQYLHCSKQRHLLLLVVVCWILDEELFLFVYGFRNKPDTIQDLSV
jgi:hypothetical protein